MIYFDLDNTIRDLNIFNIKGGPSEWRAGMPNGQTIKDYIDDNLDILVTSPPTEYYPIIKKYTKCPVIITHQREHWLPYTIYWLDRHFKHYELINVCEIPAKEQYINKDDYLVDDYPHFSSKITNNLLLISMNYNQDSPCRKRITKPSDLLPYLKEFYVS